MPPAAARAREGWPDVIKGVCIILVVMWHVVVKHSSDLPWEDAAGVPEMWTVVSAQLLPLRMPLFFVVSGMFAASAVLAPTRARLATRALRLALLYLLWVVIQTFALAAAGPDFDTARATDAWSLLLQLTVSPTNLWYLLALALYRSGRQADALRVTARERIPSIGGISAHIGLMLRQPDFDTYDLSCVQTIIMGGAASPPAMVREARERFGAAYSIRYSSTESGGCGTGTAFDADDDEALFTVGKPRGGIEVEIRDGDELWLRSPTMMSGYWRDPEATADAIVDGWLRTGDLGAIDERGNLRLLGRSKEMFIRGGYNVYPAEVEAVLADHPLVREVVVVPRPDDVMGELGVAVVVPIDPAAPPALEDLRTFGERRLARYKLPEALRVVDEVPLTPMQKVDRRALAAREAGLGPSR